MTWLRPAVLSLTLAALLGAGLALAQDGKPAAPPGPKTVAGVTFTPPKDAGWVEEAPTSRMRAAQYRLRRVEGDPRDAELVIFHFGAGAGSVEDNLDRWIAQLQQPDGRASRDVAKLEQRQTPDGLTAHLIDLPGTYVAETRPGSGERVNQPGSRLLGAIVETPGGPFFVKLVGPDATVRAAKDAFLAFVDSFQAAH